MPPSVVRDKTAHMVEHVLEDLDLEVRSRAAVNAGLHRCHYELCICSGMKPPHQLRVCQGCWSVFYCGEYCQKQQVVSQPSQSCLCSRKPTETGIDRNTEKSVQDGSGRRSRMYDVICLSLINTKPFLLQSEVEYLEPDQRVQRTETMKRLSFALEATVRA